MNQNGESQSLLNKGKKKEYLSKAWSWFKIIVSIILLLLVIYVLLDLITDKKESDKSTKIQYPKHIKSVVSIVDDFLKLCAPQVTCDPNAKYRSINGSCNNLQTPTWGAALTPLMRYLDANFNDGYYSLRRQKDGDALPNARKVNMDIFLAREAHRLDVNNVLLLPFGQLIAHDTSRLPNDVPTYSSGDAVNCCDDITSNIVRLFQCEGLIKTPPDDPFYVGQNITCLGTYRSMTSRNYSCPLYPTEFINTITHYIDASQIYGSSEENANRIRTMEGGRLNFSTNEKGEMFCPFQPDRGNTVIKSKTVGFLYDTGSPEDSNQNIGIATIQTLFLRFHNYLVSKFSILNPHWSDEILYQEARRLIGAIIQRIAYKDFLPIIIGDDYQELYGINEENIYDPTVDPTISLEMSAAAMRVLHVIIPVEFNFMKNDYETEFSVILTKWMNDPTLLPKNDNFDKLFKGFIETGGRVNPPSYNFYVSNLLFDFGTGGPKSGIDLLAGDIMRGRDVGLQPYNQVRHLCGRPLAKDFEDLVDLIHIRDINKLKKLYHTVDDIDLLVGLLLEKASEGAIVGPTTRCIIAESFYRLKAADRFFYDVQGQPGSFTPNQLKTINKITLGHIICNLTKVNAVQVDIFKTVNHDLFPSSKLKCGDELFNMNFDDWKESNKEL